MNIEELKPVKCGCGGEANIVKRFSHDYHVPVWYVECIKCNIETDDYFSEIEAITAWNSAMGATDTNVGDKERTTMVWKPAKERPAYEKGICSCGYVLSVLQRDFVYCPMCGARLEWG